MSEVLTLGEALPLEIERVWEIVREYESLPNGCGKPAAFIMKQDISKAHKAMIEGDLPGMIAAYQDLKEWKL